LGQAAAAQRAKTTAQKRLTLALPFLATEADHSKSQLLTD
jgi:hypothetical protein